MEGEYPRFKSTYLQEELVEGFHLGPDEFDFVSSHRGDTNRHGIAILLKSLLHLGYFPDGLQEMPGPFWRNSLDCCGITVTDTAGLVVLAIIIWPRSGRLPGGGLRRRRTSRNWKNGCAVRKQQSLSRRRNCSTPRAGGFKNSALSFQRNQSCNGSSTRH